MSQKLKASTITLDVYLNEKNIPNRIDWTSTDDPSRAQKTECKAFLLSLFDKHSRDTLKIDLWTEEMQVIEMDRFVYHSMRSIADTYLKATGNATLANEIQKFAHYFGEKTEILPPNIT